jgi:hypothetical protein
MQAEIRAALRGALLDPLLVLAIGRVGLRVRRSQTNQSVKTVVGTHHKVLTAYMARVSRAFAVIGGRSYSRGAHPDIQYDKQVLHDEHSTFDFTQLTGPFRGIHVRRDPRDVLVSCAHYHLKSSEPWLHEEGNWGLDGSTYQQTIRALPTMEERLLFEIDHSGGRSIARMAAWDYARPEFVELRYERMIQPAGIRYIRESLDQSGHFEANECELLEKLFKVFSAHGVVAHKRHIRNPRPSQWKEYFTPAVERRFYERFGGILKKLGYE